MLRLLPELLRSFALSSGTLRLMMHMRAPAPLHVLLDVFVDPAHLSTLDPVTVASLGKSIDELLRHVPSMRAIGLRAMGALIVYLTRQRPKTADEIDQAWSVRCGQS